MSGSDTKYLSSITLLPTVLFIIDASCKNPSVHITPAKHALSVLALKSAWAVNPVCAPNPETSYTLTRKPNKFADTA